MYKQLGWGITKTEITFEAETQFDGQDQYGICIVGDKLLCVKGDRLVSVHKQTLEVEQDIMKIDYGMLVIKDMGDKLIAGEIRGQKIHLFDRDTFKV